jgi:hypothetical protein
MEIEPVKGVEISPFQFIHTVRIEQERKKNVLPCSLLLKTEIQLSISKTVITMKSTSFSKINIIKWPIMCSVGVIAIIQYIFFSYLAYLAFPDSFDPFNNFLSQLGNYNRNPDGAIYYFLAIIFSGLLTVIFYGGFYQLFSKEKSSNLLKSILILGIANGISIFMSGVFAESVNYTLHFLFSFLIFLTLLPLLLLVNIYIRNNQIFPKIVSNLGSLVILIDLIFIITAVIGGELFENAAIMEWLSLASYFIWMITVIFYVIANQEKE